jgi:hypothetical protein
MNILMGQDIAQLYILISSKGQVFLSHTLHKIIYWWDRRGSVLYLVQAVQGRPAEDPARLRRVQHEGSPAAQD